MSILGGITRALKIAGEVGMIATGAGDIVDAIKGGKDAPLESFTAILEKAEEMSGVDFVDEDMFAMGFAIMAKGLHEGKKRKVISGQVMMANAFITEDEEEPESPKANPNG
jgi:hypothetical protein